MGNHIITEVQVKATINCTMSKALSLPSQVFNSKVQAPVDSEINLLEEAKENWAKVCLQSPISVSTPHPLRLRQCLPWWQSLNNPWVIQIITEGVRGPWTLNNGPRLSMTLRYCVAGEGISEF